MAQKFLHNPPMLVFLWVWSVKIVLIIIFVCYNSITPTLYLVINLFLCHERRNRPRILASLLTFEHGWIIKIRKKKENALTFLDTIRISSSLQNQIRALLFERVHEALNKLRRKILIFFN